MVKKQKNFLQNFTFKKNSNNLFKKGKKEKVFSDKRGSESRETPVIWVLLIILLVLIILGFIYWPQLKNKIAEIFPDFFKNETYADHSGTLNCPNEVARVKKLAGIVDPVFGASLKDYLYFIINNKPTDLYLVPATGSNNDLIYLDRGKGILGGDVALGSVSRNRAVNKWEINLNPSLVDERGSMYIKYKKLLPSISDLKTLNNAFRPPGVSDYFCKTDEDIKALEEENGCVESCSLYNGVCNKSEDCNSYDSDVTSFGTLDCKDGKVCCVKKSSEKLNDGGLSILNFSVKNRETGKTIYSSSVAGLREVKEIKEEDFVEPLTPAWKQHLNDTWVTISPTKVEPSSGKEYTLISLFKANENFCYFVRSDLALIDKSFWSYQETKGVPVSSQKRWPPTGESSIGIVLWNPADNKKVYKIVEVSVFNPNPTLTSPLNPGTVTDERFYEYAKNLEEYADLDIFSGEYRSFYVVLQKGISIDGDPDKGYQYMKFWVQKYKGTNNVDISACWKNKDSGREKCDKLDCYTGFGGGFSSTISLDNVEYRLSDTVIKNCVWPLGGLFST